ncbi:MAG: YqeG family HAD IIIA-type phosphatase [Bacillota bacterium]
MNNFRLLFPRLYVPSIFEIDLDWLHQQGIRGLMLDLDNTIICRNLEHFSAGIVAWIKELKRKNFRVCIISNNLPKRVYALAQELDLPAVCQGIKPLAAPFRRALGVLGTAPQETAIVGDQIFTDILGGNRLGLYTILVNPLPGKEFWATRLINRQLEKLVLWWLKRRKAEDFRRGRQNERKD